MNRSVHRTRTGRAMAAGATAVAASLALSVAVALPASAHPGFGSSAGAAFAPNPQGGTGAAGQAPPYAANTPYTLALRIPDEVDATVNGKDDNNVGATVVVPAGWTNPTCETAANGFGVRKSVTVNGVTNQVGDAVAGWSCVVEDVTTPAGTRKQFRWSGPQAATLADGAQYFLFKVTTPTPATATSYGQLESALPTGFLGAEGFVATQYYASYDQAANTGLRYWYPPRDPRGTGSSSTTTGPGGTAGGLVRSVSPATGGPGYQTLTAVVPGAPAGTFSMTIPTNGAISLTRGTNTTGPYSFTGALNRITVTDTRENRSGWELSGVAAAFSGLEATSARYLGWTPRIFLPGAGATAGDPVANALDATPGPGLETAKRLARATGAYAAGEASIGADLNLKLPRELPGGTYNTTLTVTAI